MIQIISKIEASQYHKLIDYLFSKCDIFTFQVANYYQEYLTYKNTKYFLHCDLNNYTNEEDCDQYIEYKTRIMKYIDQFKNFFIAEYVDVEYIGYGVSTYKREIKVVKLDKSLVDILKTTNGLYDWKFPNMPEDLCFYSKGKCLLSSVAHEGLCFIYADTEETVSAIKEIGLDYVLDYSNREIPELVLENKTENISEKCGVIKKFLMNKGVSEKTAENDALKMEHYLSEETYACIKAKNMK